jgi:serine protease Do
MRYFILLLITIPSFLYGQSLSPERVSKIKSATVRVIVEGGISVGSGFFVTETGLLVTCLHVALPAIKNKKRIYIEFQNGDTTEVGFPDILNSDTSYVKGANVYDFCLLSAIRPGLKKTPFLKLGDFGNAMEGDDIYTCGYPLGMSYQFISKGIISSKYINNSIWTESLGIKYYIPRNEALLDITLNRGNSGGAIIKMGKTENEDEVIGIADFAINPLGNYADSIISSASDPAFNIKMNVVYDSIGNQISSTDINRTLVKMAEAHKSTSIGVSGCVSINHLKAILGKYGLK